MEDIVIKKNTLKREIFIWSVSLVIAFGLNAYAIIKYDSPWAELLTQIPVIILISVVIYFLQVVIRGIFKTLVKIIVLFKK